MSQFPTLHSTLRTAEALVAAGDLGGALAEIEAQIVSWSAIPALTQNAIWGSRELDRLVAAIGELISRDAPVDLDIHVPSLDGTRARDVFLFTWAASGGHVRVAGDLIRSAPDREGIVVLTEQRTPLTSEIFEAFATSRERVLVLPNLPLRARTRALIGLLEQLRADRLFLFNHHHDCSIIASARPAAARKMFYVHHCDFSPALGVFHSDAVHLDVTPRLYSFCRETLGIENKFLPLVAQDLGPRGFVGRSEISEPVLATCGSSIKYDLNYQTPYHKVVAELLARTSAKLYHIGELRPDQLAQIRTQLRLLGISETRWIYLPFVPSVWRALQELNVDLYISSFPHGGARVAIEVMGSGTPAVWHLSAPRNGPADLNLAYQGALSWQNAGQLIGIVTNLTSDWIRTQGSAARAHYECLHAPSVLERINWCEFEDAGDCTPLVHRSFAYEFEHLEQSWHRLAEQGRSRNQTASNSLPLNVTSNSYFPMLQDLCEHFDLAADELLKPSTPRARVVKALITDALESVDIDADKYARNNPDLLFAYGNDRGEIARHFQTQGYFEDRAFPVANFDAEYYRATNPDIAMGSENWEARDLESHYVSAGIREFRPPNESSAPSAAAWKNALASRG